MDHPLPWLRYLDASDVDDDEIDFAGMEIWSSTGEKLGTTEGFIVDSDSARPDHVVADAGGWFKSKHFLLPVGHAKLGADGETLVTDLPRDRVNRFPGFDLDEFTKMSDEDFRRINDQICDVCSVTAVSFSVSEPPSAAWTRPEYAFPDWWHADSPRPTTETAHTVSEDYRSPDAAARPDALPARDRVLGSEPDPSPHFDGRAQPGDVVGVETGGEQTHIGDTAEDENRRRRDAEESAARRHQER